MAEDEKEKYCLDCKYYGEKSGYGLIPGTNFERTRNWCYLINDELSLRNACPDFKEAPSQMNPAVLGYQERKKDENSKFNYMFVLQFLTALLLFFTVVVGVMGYTVQLDTQKIVEESSIPNKASLVIYSDVELNKLTFSRAALADNNPNSADMDIKIQNSGRVDSGTINVWWNRTTSNSSFSIWPSHENPTNIEGGKRKLVQMNIRCSECMSYYGEHKDEILNENLINLVPKGELELELIVKCSQCTPDQQIHTIKFKICLYDEPEECDSFSA